MDLQQSEIHFSIDFLFFRELLTTIDISNDCAQCQNIRFRNHHRRCAQEFPMRSLYCILIQKSTRIIVDLQHMNSMPLILIIRFVLYLRRISLGTVHLIILLVLLFRLTGSLWRNGDRIIGRQCFASSLSDTLTPLTVENFKDRKNYPD